MSDKIKIKHLYINHADFPEFEGMQLAEEEICALFGLRQEDTHIDRCGYREFLTTRADGSALDIETDTVVGTICDDELCERCQTRREEQALKLSGSVRDIAGQIGIDYDEEHRRLQRFTDSGIKGHVAESEFKEGTLLKFKDGTYAGHTVGTYAFETDRVTAVMRVTPVDPIFDKLRDGGVHPVSIGANIDALKQPARTYDPTQDFSSISSALAEILHEEYDDLGWAALVRRFHETAAEMRIRGETGFADELARYNDAILEVGDIGARAYVFVYGIQLTEDCTLILDYAPHGAPDYGKGKALNSMTVYQSLRNRDTYEEDQAAMEATRRRLAKNIPKLYPKCEGRVEVFCMDASAPNDIALVNWKKSDEPYTKANADELEMTLPQAWLASRMQNDIDDGLDFYMKDADGKTIGAEYTWIEIEHIANFHKGLVTESTHGYPFEVLETWPAVKVKMLDKAKEGKEITLTTAQENVGRSQMQPPVRFMIREHGGTTPNGDPDPMYRGQFENLTDAVEGAKGFNAYRQIDIIRETYDTHSRVWLITDEYDRYGNGYDEHVQGKPTEDDAIAGLRTAIAFFKCDEECQSESRAEAVRGGLDLAIYHQQHAAVAGCMAAVLKQFEGFLVGGRAGSDAINPVDCRDAMKALSQALKAYD